MTRVPPGVAMELGTARCPVLRHQRCFCLGLGAVGRMLRKEPWFFLEQTPWARLGEEIPERASAALGSCESRRSLGLLLWFFQFFSK